MKTAEAAKEKVDSALIRWEQAIETKEAAVVRQQQYQQQQQHAQVCEPAAAATAQKECTAAAAEDDTTAVQVAAAEIAQLRMQVQRLDRQLDSEIGFSSGLLNAQPGLAGATARRKQMAAATDTCKKKASVWTGGSSRGSWKQKVQMGSKLHSGNAAKESTSSNRTGMALGWVGVRPDVHRRQQAQLAVYRKKCQQAKIWKSDKFGKIWNKTAAAAGPDKMEAAAAAAE